MTDLADFVREIRALGRLPELVAAEGAPLVEAAIRKQADAGVDPKGQAWEPTKAGGKPLKNAGAAVNAVATKRAIVVKLGAPEIFHNMGTKRVPKRQILPDAGDMPDHVAEALRTASDRAFARATGAR